MVEVAVVVAGLVAACVLHDYIAIRALQRARLHRTDEIEGWEAIAIKVCDEWATAQGFELVGSYRFRCPPSPPVLITAWQWPGVDVHFCLYQRPKKWVPEIITDRVTQFTNGASLTTAVSVKAMVLPCPQGMFMQAFPGAGLDELWDRHLAAEDLLLRAARLQPASGAVPFDHRFLAFLRDHVAFVRTRAFWPIRVYYWHLTARLRANKPVEWTTLDGPVFAHRVQR